MASGVAGEPDLPGSQTKKSTKSKLANPLKTLREVGRSASLRLRRSTDDEMSSQGAESSSGGGTLERGAKLKKTKDKKKKNEAPPTSEAVEHPLTPDEEDEGKKKGKKKKGSSLVRKFSSKYRSNKSGGEETPSPRHVVESEISGNEDSQSLASNSTFASSARTPDQSPSHPPSALVEEEPVLLFNQKSWEQKTPKLIAMTTEINKTIDDEDFSPSLSESTPTPPQVMEDTAASLQDELNAAEQSEVVTADPPVDVEHVENKDEFLDARQLTSPEVREIVFPAGLEDTATVENAGVDKASQMAQGGERREHLYKILVIGELGTGKTSIIKRYVHQFFSQHYRATIGVDFALKVLTWDQNTIIRLQLWDIAGQERFGNMTRVYYKEAVGAFIVFDVTRTATFDAVLKWKADLDSKVQLPDGSPIPCVLLANKCDQQKEGVVNSPARMDEYCKEHGFSGWYETSAKENINIDEAARFLVTKILQNDKLANLTSPKDKDGFALDGTAKDEKGAQKSCAC